MLNAWSSDSNLGAVPGGYGWYGAAIEVAGVVGNAITGVATALGVNTLTLTAKHSGDLMVFAIFDYVSGLAFTGTPATGLGGTPWVTSPASSTGQLVAMVAPTTGATVTASWTGTFGGGNQGVLGMVIA